MLTCRLKLPSSEAHFNIPPPLLLMDFVYYYYNHLCFRSFHFRQRVKEHIQSEVGSFKQTVAIGNGDSSTTTRSPAPSLNRSFPSNDI